MSNQHQTVADALFKSVGEGESLYAILDGARTLDIAFRLRSADVEHDSLYRGRSEELLWHVAPYLILCEQNSEFFRWMLEQGWGNSWGIFLVSGTGLEEMCKHFRKFLMVKTENHKELYFRFYDPRVLRAFLPTCTTEEVEQFFGPASCYLMESDRPEILLKFTASAQGTEQEKVLLPFQEHAGAESLGTDVVR